MTVNNSHNNGARETNKIKNRQAIIEAGETDKFKAQKIGSIEKPQNKNNPSYRWEYIFLLIPLLIFWKIRRKT